MWASSEGALNVQRDDGKFSLRVIKAEVRHNRVAGAITFDTYTVPLHSVDAFFAREDGTLITKDWNKKYASAQSIFNGSVESVFLLAMTRTAHNRLYNGTFSLGLTPTDEVTLTSGNDFLRMFHWGRVPAAPPGILGFGLGGSLSGSSNGSGLSGSSSGSGLSGSSGGSGLGGSGHGGGKEVPFTYVITVDGVLRFSQTEHPLTGWEADTVLELPSAVDFMSKHAVMANGAEEVVYAGEMWVATFKGRDVLVIDNGSGTYAPGTEEDQLRRLESLLKYNFPGLAVVAKTYDEALSPEALSAAVLAVQQRGLAATGAERRAKAAEPEAFEGMPGPIFNL